MKRTLPVLLAVLAIAVLLSMMHFLQNAPRAAAPDSAVSTDITMPLHVLVDKEDAPAMEVVLSHRGETVTYVQDAQVYKAKGYFAASSPKSPPITRPDSKNTNNINIFFSLVAICAPPYFSFVKY